jgi:hypothetical protein
MFPAFLRDRAARGTATATATAALDTTTLIAVPRATKRSAYELGL